MAYFSHCSHLFLFTEATPVQDYEIFITHLPTLCPTSTMRNYQFQRILSFSLLSWRTLGFSIFLHFSSNYTCYWGLSSVIYFQPFLSLQLYTKNKRLWIFVADSVANSNIVPFPVIYYQQSLLDMAVQLAN